MLIYKITNLINNKIYIGQTTFSVEKRFKMHLNAFKKGQDTKLYNAMQQYGVENFIPEVIEYCESKQQLDQREIYWISYYNSTVNGYNMALGGDINPMHSPQCKQRHDTSMSSAEVRHKISNSLKSYRKEHPFTLEHQLALSKSAMGNHNFGSGDTRSIACYCIDSDGSRHDFHSYKDAGMWWYNTYKPFGEVYVQITLQRKIVASINGKPITWHKGQDKILIDNIKWYKNI